MAAFGARTKVRLEDCRRQQDSGPFLVRTRHWSGVVEETCRASGGHGRLA